MCKSNEIFSTSWTLNIPSQWQTNEKKGLVRVSNWWWHFSGGLFFLGWINHILHSTQYSDNHNLFIWKMSEGHWKAHTNNKKWALSGKLFAIHKRIYIHRVPVSDLFPFHLPKTWADFQVGRSFHIGRNDRQHRQYSKNNNLRRLVQTDSVQSVSPSISRRYFWNWIMNHLSMSRRIDVGLCLAPPTEWYL